MFGTDRGPGVVVVLVPLGPPVDGLLGFVTCASTEGAMRPPVHAALLGDTSDRALLRRRVLTELNGHPSGPLTQLVGVLPGWLPRLSSSMD